MSVEQNFECKHHALCMNENSDQDLREYLSHKRNVSVTNSSVCEWLISAILISYNNMLKRLVFDRITNRKRRQTTRKKYFGTNLPVALSNMISKNKQVE